MTYPRAKVLVLAFLTLYAVIGFSAHVASRDTEDVYPFFSWFLFVTVPPRVQSMFDIQLIAVGGTPIQPISILERPDVFSLDGVMARQIIAEVQEFGRALSQHNDAGAQAIRKALERHFHTPASYAVRQVMYDPLKYFFSQEISTSTVLAKFNFSP